jgi:hypothetical protein
MAAAVAMSRGRCYLFAVTAEAGADFALSEE